MGIVVSGNFVGGVEWDPDRVIARAEDAVETLVNSVGMFTTSEGLLQVLLALSLMQERIVGAAEEANRMYEVAVQDERWGGAS